MTWRSYHEERVAERRRAKERTRRPRALGAYIFAGGFTLGVRESFDVGAVFEDGAYGVASARAAMPDIPVHTDARTWPWRDHVDVDLLYGNPPCAAWSAMGRRVGGGSMAWEGDARVDCTRTHFNLLELVRPKVWVWESVPQAFRAGRSFVDELAERALTLGYAVDYVLHNARYLGAYQSRNRFFMVVTRLDIDWACDFIDSPGVLDALKKIPKRVKHEPGIDGEKMLPRKVFDEVEPGEQVREARARLMAKAKVTNERAQFGIRPSYGFVRLYPDRPSHAIVHPCAVHPIEPRFLTITEMKQLGGWPLDYPLVATNVDARARLLMRAVLPPVGAWLGRQVAAAVRRDRPAPYDRVRLVDLRSPPGSCDTDFHGASSLAASRAT